MNKFIARSTLFKGLGLSLIILLMTSCSMLTGTKVWCEYMEEKPKGDWSVNEVKDYATHCVFDD